MTKGFLHLETGDILEGDWIGYETEMEGEIVFNTSMTGFQEMITDPSYSGQILTFTYPIIGSYGLNKLDFESQGIHVNAVILNDLCEEPSHYQATSTFHAELKSAKVPGLANVDTRALVSILRKHQTVRGKLTKNKEEITKWKEKDTKSLVNKVAVKEKQTYGNGENHIVMVDFGYKASILSTLLENHCKVTIVPYHTSFETIQSLQPNGILLSNGPGNPMDLKEILPAIKEITGAFPTFGIGLGHQLIALSYGAKTQRLSYGHRGNHPVKNVLTGKVYMTSQNHGYTVAEESIDLNEFQVVYKNINDSSIEGFQHRNLPVQSVQFQPEANPGPGDMEFILQEFVQQVVASGGKKYVQV